MIKSLMIQSQLIQLICDFRRTQTDQNSQYITRLPITDAQYNSFLLVLLQTSDMLALQNTTKFLAKKYMDTFLCSNYDINQQKLVLITITCLRVAAKFNQISHQIKLNQIQYCVQLGGGIYTSEQFFRCEVQLIKILNFKFHLTTPYDYLIIKNILPKQKKILTLLQSVIDFSITMIEIRNYNAEEIFFGSLLYCCRKKDVGEMCYTVIRNTTQKWKQAEQVSKRIQSKLKEILNQ